MAVARAMDLDCDGGRHVGGWLFPAASVTLKPLATIFLRLIKRWSCRSSSAHSSSGSQGTGMISSAWGQLALATLVFFEIMTTIALVFGLVAGNLAHPGAGVSIGVAASTPAVSTAKITLAGMLEHVVPQELRRVGRQQRPTPGGGVCRDVRCRAGAGARQSTWRDARVLPEPRRSVVQDGGDRDAVCTDRHWCGDRGDNRTERAGRPHRPREARTHDVRGVDRFHPRGDGAGCDHVSRAVAHVPASRARTSPDRVLDLDVGGRAPQRDAE